MSKIIPTSITHSAGDNYLVEIGNYGDADFPYLYAIISDYRDAESWLLRHCQRFGAGVVFAMPDKSLAIFN